MKESSRYYHKSSLPNANSELEWGAKVEILLKSKSHHSPITAIVNVFVYREAEVWEMR